MIKFIFVHWEKKHLVLSTSHPGPQKGEKYMPGHEPKIGRNAKKLYEAGYTYYGFASGWNMINYIYTR